jgi:hypothetical protein
MKDSTAERKLVVLSFKLALIGQVHCKHASLEFKMKWKEESQVHSTSTSENIQLRKIEVQSQVHYKDAAEKITMLRQK